MDKQFEKEWSLYWWKMITRGTIPDDVNYLCINPNLKWDMTRKRFIDNKYKQHHQDRMRQVVFPRLIDERLHPKHFSKLYEWGHIEHVDEV